PSCEAPSREAPSREAPSREAPSCEAPSREAPSTNGALSSTVFFVVVFLSLVRRDKQIPLYTANPTERRRRKVTKLTLFITREGHAGWTAKGGRPDENLT